MGSLDPRNLLLTVKDLPGAQWRQMDERLWRTGVGTDADWARLARESKSRTGWRSFEQGCAHRWMWTQATILPTAEAAQSAFADAPNRMMANLRSAVAVEESHQKQPPTIVGASTVWAREDRTSGDMGDGQALYLVWAVDNVLSAAAWSGFADSWTWSSVAELAAVQTNRIAAALRSRNSTKT